MCKSPNWPSFCFPSFQQLETWFERNVYLLPKGMRRTEIALKLCMNLNRNGLCWSRGRRQWCTKIFHRLRQRLPNKRALFVREGRSSKTSVMPLRADGKGLSGMAAPRPTAGRQAMGIIEVEFLA
ncbi:uncharacterized protein TM35_000261730 [Trypanosoma theileri]|uniref:Uncharacterized protein n=1 Tax=Trypanosoma theileri TaxID=67003 RepID=A0A1X0NQ41_9TRYP|nr:uncharacterized protein TM35_000261730 [Trypanosoma theileri]ORC86721.1 hypothetical protein TM35_000261730 [Trypanosoma theileri]